MTVRTAVALVVRDEAHDILTWVAWHRALGFSTVLAFDDGSRDGTFELLRLAGRLADVRVERISMPDVPFFYFRQELVYRAVLDRYRDAFDWIAFLDADEYLWLPRAHDLPAFLDGFPDADAVAIDWCPYGSAGRVLTPGETALEAFTRHGPEPEAGSHVKCIVRPRAVGPGWLNVHAFDVPLARSVDADGRPFGWAEHPGVMNRPASWANAKVMHLQCRSMEQFVERARKRQDVSIGRELWDWTDRNEREDRSPLRLMPQVRAFLDRAVDALLDEEVPEGDDRAAPAVRIARIRGARGGRLRLDAASHPTLSPDATGPEILALWTQDRPDALLVTALGDPIGSDAARPPDAIGGGPALPVRLRWIPADGHHELVDSGGGTLRVGGGPGSATEGPEERFAFEPVGSARLPRFLRNAARVLAAPDRITRAARARHDPHPIVASLVPALLSLVDQSDVAEFAASLAAVRPSGNQLRRLKRIGWAPFQRQVRPSS